MFRTATRLRAATPALSPPTSLASVRTHFSTSSHRPFGRFQRLQHDYLKPRKVRFWRPLFTRRRLATWGLYSACFAGYYYYFFPNLLHEFEIVDADDQPNADDHPDADSLDDESHEDSLFIPLTWPRQLPREFYKGSDPEWQDFANFSRDKIRIKRLHVDLAKQLVDGVTSAPALVKALGPDPKCGRYWLDLVFPDGPPQDYSRLGIEIADDFIALSSQRMDPDHYHRLSRALWPTATINAVYQSYKVILFFQYRRLKQAFGLETKAEPGSPEERLEHALKMMEARDQQQQGNLVSGNQGVTASSTSASPSTSDNSTSSSLLSWMSKLALPGSPVEMPLAVQMFHRTVAKGWAPKDMEPPRGAFVVQGLVQVSGARAIATFDVKAFYDPRHSRFVMINAGVKNIKKRNQAPRGG